MGDIFDKWIALQRKLSERRVAPFCKTRQLWWCSLGINIGTETRGKNELFERPVLIMRIFNRETILILPLTSQRKLDKHHIEVMFNGITSFVKLNQSRTINTRRLSRKIGRLPKEVFNTILEKYLSAIKDETPS
jgi:mRNA interferase MazF